MSTRCLIAKQIKDGRYETIYCHFDGYIAGVGAILDANYDTEEKVDQLIKLGDISSLAETVEKTKVLVSGGNSPKAKICSQEDLEAEVDGDIEFIYCYEANGLWTVFMARSQTWGYLPDLLKAQGIESHFAAKWETALTSAKDGDTYEQMKKAEKEGALVDLLFDALDALPDEDYESLKQRWDEVWAYHNFYTEKK